MEQLLKHLCDIFELESIEPSSVLRDLDLWDSLSVISLLAVLDSEFGVILEAEELADLITVADLVEYVVKNQSR